MNVTSKKFPPCTWEELPKKIGDSVATGIYYVADNGSKILAHTGVIAIVMLAGCGLSQLKRVLS